MAPGLSGPVYYKAQDFHKGLAITRRKRFYGVIDEKGMSVIPHRFDRLTQEGDYFKVKKNGRFGFYDSKGQEISPTIYSHVGKYIEGRARVRMGREIKFIDLTRHELPTPIFKWAKNYKYGLAVVKSDEGLGVIDYEGNLVLNYRNYWDIDVVSNRKIKAQVDRFSSELIKLDSIPSPFNWVDPDSIQIYSEIFETVKGKFGYDDIHPPKEGVIVASCNQLYGLADTKGKILFDTKFEKVSYRDGLYKIVVDGNISYLTPEGEWIYPRKKASDDK